MIYVFKDKKKTQHVPVQLKCSAGVRDVWVPPPFSWLHLCFSASQHALGSDVSRAARCASCSSLLSLRDNPKNYKKGFFCLFFLFIQPFFFFHAAALFPRRTNVLQLIENDPLTAVWNNEASFPHIFSRRMAALSCTSVHIKVPYQGGIWGWRNYWSAWEPGPPYLLLLHRGRDGIMEPKARLSVRRQWLDNAWEGCFLGILDNSVFKSGCIKGNQKATRNLWAVMGSIYDIIASKCVYLALK